VKFCSADAEEPCQTTDREISGGLSERKGVMIDAQCARGVLVCARCCAGMSACADCGIVVVVAVLSE
jgi:hypothetical protein